MGNDNGLVNYCASRLRAHIRQGVLHDEKIEVSWEQGSKLLRSYHIELYWRQTNASFQNIFNISLRHLLLMVLYRWFVCIIGIIYHLKLKVKYTHNSELHIMSGAIWGCSLDSNLTLFFLMLHGAAEQSSIYFCGGD